MGRRLQGCKAGKYHPKTTLKFMMNAKPSQPRFGPCHAGTDLGLTQAIFNIFEKTQSRKTHLSKKLKYFSGQTSTKPVMIVAKGFQNSFYFLYFSCKWAKTWSICAKHADKMLQLVFFKTNFLQNTAIFLISDSKSSKLWCFWKNSWVLGKNLNHFEEKL